MRWINVGRAGWMALALAAAVNWAGAASAETKAGEGPKVGDQPSAEQAAPAEPAPAESAPAETSAEQSAPAALPPDVKFSFSVPTVRTIRSSMDEAALRDVLAGNIAAHAAELAALRAERIAFPEVSFDYSVPDENGEVINGHVAWHNVRLLKVRRGVAQAVIIDGVESTNNEGTTKVGRQSMEDFNIAGILQFFGLVKPERPSSRPAILYRDFIAQGGTLTLTKEKGACTFGGQSAEYVRARPPRSSLAEIMTLAKESAGKDAPDPATLSTLVDYLSDIVEGVEIGRVRVSGFDCGVIDDDGKPVRVTIGSVNVGEYAAPRWPQFVVRNIGIGVPGDGSMSLGQFRFKGFDFGHALETVKSAHGEFSEEWADAHARDLIPEFPGLSFAGFAIDIPAADSSSERIKGSIAAFDLSLDDYINGIPSRISTYGRHIVALLPKESQDTSVQRLVEYGIDHFDLGFDVAVHWDEASEEIRLDRFNIDGDGMGSLAVTSALGGATRNLFSTDNNAALAAALGLTLKGVKIDMRDSGLADIILQAAAKEAHADVKKFREALAGVTQGTMLLFLGNVANSEEITRAVGDFINGARTLSVKVAAKDPMGIPLAALAELQDNPLAIIDLLAIQAIAK